MKIRSFNQIDSFAYVDVLIDTLRKEIENKGKEYILGVDEAEYKKYLKEAFFIEPLNIDFSTENVAKPHTTKEIREDRFYQRRYEVEAYNFIVSYNFTGNASLFKVKPSSWIMVSSEIEVEESKGIVSINFKIYKQDVEEFKRTKNEIYGNAFANLDNANVEANKWNVQLESLVNSTFDKIKNKYLGENDFFEAINIKVNSNTSSIFTAPTIQKK